ncbi:U3 small nucleolar RNA-associated protein 25 homolog [Styela clava]
MSESSSEDESSHPYVDLISLVKTNNHQEEIETDSEDDNVIPKRQKLEEGILEKKSSSQPQDDSSNESEDNEDVTDVLMENSDSENEDDNNDSAEILIFGESDDEDNFDKSKNLSCDYYKQHLETNIDYFVQHIEKNKPQRRDTLEWPMLGKIQFMNRSEDPATNEFLPKVPIKKNTNIETYRQTYHIRKIVIDNWMQFDKRNKTKSKKDKHNDLFNLQQKELFTLLSSYVDVSYTDTNLLNTSSSIQGVYCFHAVNHVIRSRAKVLLNTSRLRKMTPEQREQSEYRDQGITRPKVLILVPFKETALRVINIMLELFKQGDKFEVSYKKRFRDEFSQSEDDIDGGFSKKPEDYQCLFAGNTDEHFRIGIALLRNSVRLYSPFYSSDIIVASPLGLRTVIGSEGEKHHEHDFLSSIELVIMDQTDVFLMQNWEHVLHIFEHLNITPKDSHGVDFSRVRNFSLDGRNKFYRQTVVISNVHLPQISSIFTKWCCNYKGFVKTENIPEKGNICAIAKQLPQVFHKLSAPSLVESSEARFRFFVDKLYKQYKDPSMSHTLIYVPQYFDFVRLRNFMRKQKKEGSGPIFGHINDYSTPSAANKTKRRFYTGKCPLMLYTERFHFYNRARIRGMRHLIFYELPTYPLFYVELCNMVRDSHQGDGVTSSSSVNVMYTKFDTQKLASTVGMSRCRQLQTSTRTVHMFVAGTNDD